MEAVKVALSMWTPRKVICWEMPPSNKNFFSLRVQPRDNQSDRK
jgi:hypothetical protein